MVKNVKINELNLNLIKNFLKTYQINKKKYFGDGNSYKKFFKIINTKKFWKIDTQKYYNDKAI